MSRFATGRRDQLGGQQPSRLGDNHLEPGWSQRQMKPTDYSAFSSQIEAMSYYFSSVYFKRSGLLWAFILVPLFVAVILWPKLSCYGVGYVLQLPSVFAAGIGFWKTPNIITPGTSLRALFIKVICRPSNIEVRGVGTMRGFAEVSWVAANPRNSSVEQRVEFLERKTDGHADQIRAADKRHKELTDVVSRQEGLIVAGDERITSKLESALLDGLPIAFVSLVWFVIGLVMAGYCGRPP